MSSEISLKTYKSLALALLIGQNPTEDEINEVLTAEKVAELENILIIPKYSVKLKYRWQINRHFYDPYLSRFLTVDNPELQLHEIKNQHDFDTQIQYILMECQILIDRYRSKQ